VEDAPFHVLITSYHVVVSDAQYFHRIQWQFLVLDEAQAIKNAQSQRWKSLLSLRCRNRLLLTGTNTAHTNHTTCQSFQFCSFTLSVEMALA
jgi:DNA helicase INO80